MARYSVTMDRSTRRDYKWPSINLLHPKFHTTSFFFSSPVLIVCSIWASRVIVLEILYPFTAKENLSSSIGSKFDELNPIVSCVERKFHWDSIKRKEIFVLLPSIPRVGCAVSDVRVTGTIDCLEFQSWEHFNLELKCYEWKVNELTKSGTWRRSLKCFRNLNSLDSEENWIARWKCLSSSQICTEHKRDWICQASFTSEGVEAKVYWENDFWKWSKCNSDEGDKTGKEFSWENTN